MLSQKDAFNLQDRKTLTSVSGLECELVGHAPESSAQEEIKVTVVFGETAKGQLPLTLNLPLWGFLFGLFSVLSVQTRVFTLCLDSDQPSTHPVCYLGMGMVG